MPDPGEKQLLSADDIRRAVARLARRVQQRILEFEGETAPLGELDITLYRDDVHQRAPRTLSPTSIPVDISDKTVVLVDDVLYTGRTIRAALDALIDLGR